MLLQYGMALETHGCPEAALKSISEAVVNRRRNRPGTRYLGQMLEDQALVLVELGRYPKAELLLEESAGIRKKVGLKMNTNYLTPSIRLALATGKADEAMNLIERYYGPAPDSAPPSVDLMNNLDARARVALAKGDGRAAVVIAARLVNTIDASGLKPYLKTRRGSAMLKEGEGYLLEDDAAKALPLLQSAVEAATETVDAQSPNIAAAEATLGICYLNLGDRETARNLLSKSLSVLRVHKELGEPYRRPARQLAEQLARF
jgi:tetratricopeptide (TPR) repeat protein